MVRRFVTEELDPHVEEWEAAEHVPLHDLFGRLAELGLLGLEYESAYGGQEAEHAFTAGLARELERGELTWDVDQLRRLAESAQDGDLANVRAALGDAEDSR